jgi:hypothetical protein
MIVIEEYPCENVDEAKFRERYWIETCQSTLNKYIPTRTQQEYTEVHKEQIKQYKEQYYKQNNEKIKEKQNQKIKCECGKYYQRSDKSQHIKSKKHISIINNLSNEVQEQI